MVPRVPVTLAEYSAPDGVRLSEFVDEVLPPLLASAPVRSKIPFTGIPRQMIAVILTAWNEAHPPQVFRTSFDDDGLMCIERIA